MEADGRNPNRTSSTTPLQNEPALRLQGVTTVHLHLLPAQSHAQNKMEHFTDILVHFQGALVHRRLDEAGGKRPSASGNGPQRLRRCRLSPCTKPSITRLRRRFLIWPEATSRAAAAEAPRTGYLQRPRARSMARLRYFSALPLSRRCWALTLDTSSRDLALVAGYPRQVLFAQSGEFITLHR